MKKTVVLLLIISVTCAIITGCGQRVSKNAQTKASAGASKTGTAPDAKSSDNVKKNAEAAQSESAPPAELPKNPTAADVLNHLAGIYKSLKSLSLEGTVYQTINIEGKERTVDTPAKILYSSPNKVRLDTGTKDGEMSLISNGKTMYMYMAGMNVYQKKSSPKSPVDIQGKRQPGIGALGLLSGMNITPYVKSAKIVRSEKIGGVDTYVIQYPVNIEKGVTATETLWVGKKDSLLHQIKVVTSVPPTAIPADFRNPDIKGPVKITQKTYYKSVVANKQIPSKTFEFVPPSGAQDMAALHKKEPMSPPDLTGKAAPAFSIPSLGGKQISLSDYKGKPVLLVFWAMESPQSKEMLPRYQKLQDDLKGAKIIGVLLGSDKSGASKFIKDKGITFPTLFDTMKCMQTALSYGVMDIPVIYVVGSDGKVKGKIIGPKTQEQLKTEADKLGVK